MSNPLVSLLFATARAVLPDWGDVLVNIADRTYAEWDAVALAARDGWTAEDDTELSDAVTASVQEIPRLPGYLEGDERKLGDAAAVLVRWIASARPTVRKRRPLFPKLAARHQAMLAARRA